MTAKPWATQPLVVCTDGPMVGQWYLQTDWDERVAAAKHMVAKGQRRVACLDYAPSGGEPVPHPDEPAAVGTPLTYRKAGAR